MLKEHFGVKKRFLTAIQCSVGAAIILVCVLTTVATCNGDTETTEEDLTTIMPLEESAVTLVLNEGQEKASLNVTEAEKTEEYLGEMEIAAYCSCKRCVKDSDGYITYSGQRPAQGITVAADLELFQIGDKLRIGDHVYEVQDKLSARAKEKLSLYFDDHEEALVFGRAKLPVYLLHQEEVYDGTSLGVFDITGYCSCEECCGEKEVYLTKSETIPRARHTVAVDLSILEMGAKIEIDGIVYTVEDTGKSVTGNVIDIYFDTHEEAVRFGRQKKEVYLVQ